MTSAETEEARASIVLSWARWRAIFRVCLLGIPAEGNRNDGDNFVLWDLAFGTNFTSRGVHPWTSASAGRIASGFLRQLAPRFSAMGALAIAGHASSPNA